MTLKVTPKSYNRKRNDNACPCKKRRKERKSEQQIKTNSRNVFALLKSVNKILIKIIINCPALTNDSKESSKATQERD